MACQFALVGVPKLVRDSSLARWLFDTLIKFLLLLLLLPCHKAAIFPRGTKKALFYLAKLHPHGFHSEA